MKINKLLKVSLLLTAGFSLTACFNSQPDISGVWIPEKTAETAIFYDYLTIKKLDNRGNYKVVARNYQIKNINKFVPKKLPLLIGSKETVVTFVKDDTYCYEPLVVTACLVFTDNKLRHIPSGNVFVKTSKNPPEIPVNQ